jgi:hypothetical protein
MSHLFLFLYFFLNILLKPNKAKNKAESDLNKKEINENTELNNTLDQINCETNEELVQVNQSDETNNSVVYLSDEEDSEEIEEDAVFNPFKKDNNRSFLSKLYWILTLPLTTLFYFTIPGNIISHNYS